MLFTKQLKNPSLAMREREGERERESQETVGIYTKFRYISREPGFFVLLSRETDKVHPYNLGATCLYSWQTPKRCDSADCSLRLTTRTENFCHYIFFSCSHILPSVAEPTQFFPRYSRGLCLPCLP